MRWAQKLIWSTRCGTNTGHELLDTFPLDGGTLMDPRYVMPYAVAALALATAGCPTSPPQELRDADDGSSGGDATVGDVADVGGDGEAADTGPAGDSDAGPSDTDSSDGGDAGPRMPATNFYYFTTGGGIAASSNFEIRINFGAPSPRGVASGADHRLHLAPVSP